MLGQIRNMIFLIAAISVLSVIQKGCSGEYEKPKEEIDWKYLMDSSGNGNGAERTKIRNSAAWVTLYVQIPHLNS